MTVDQAMQTVATTAEAVWQVRRAGTKERLRAIGANREEIAAVLALNDLQWIATRDKQFAAVRRQLQTWLEAEAIG